MAVCKSCRPGEYAIGEMGPTVDRFLQSGHLDLYGTRVSTSLVHLACQRGWVDVLRSISPLDPHALALDDKLLCDVTPFQCALQAYTDIKMSNVQDTPTQGLVQTLIFMLEQGADADTSTSNPTYPTALFVALAKPFDRSLIGALIDYGCSTNYTTKCSTPLCTCLGWPAREDRGDMLEVVEMLLEAGADPNLCPSPFQFSIIKPPLHLAVRHGPDLIRMLLDHGADINIMDCTPTPLIEILCKADTVIDQTTRVEVLKHLLKSPSRLNLDYRKNSKSYLMDLIANLTGDHAEFLDELLRAREDMLECLDFPTLGKLNPLHSCFMRHNLNMGQACVMIKHGALVNLCVQGLHGQCDSCTQYSSCTILQYAFSQMAHVKGELDDIIKWVPEFVTGLVNRGALSTVYYSFRKGRTPNLQQKKDGSEVLCNILHLLTNLHLTAKVETLKTIASEAVSVFFKAKLHHCMTRMHLLKYTEQISSLSSDLNTPALTSVSEMLQQHNTSVVSLQDLCVSTIRMHISTVHGAALLPCDLRAMAKRLCLPKPLECLIPVNTLELFRKHTSHYALANCSGQGIMLPICLSCQRIHAD